MARKAKSGPAADILKVGRCTEPGGYRAIKCGSPASWVPITYVRYHGPDYVYDNRRGHRWDWRCGTHSPTRGLETRWRNDETLRIAAETRRSILERQSDLARKRDAIVDAARKCARGEVGLNAILHAVLSYEDALKS